MKNYSFKLFKITALLIFGAKFSSWIFNYSVATNYIIDFTMFSFIGICYLIFGYFLENKLNKMIVILSGLYLIVWKFLPENNYLLKVVILAIVLPTLIGKFSKETKSLAES